jgi:hypothetical protein
MSYQNNRASNYGRVATAFFKNHQTKSVDIAEFSRIEHSNVLELCTYELKSILKTGQ